MFQTKSSCYFKYVFSVYKDHPRDSKLVAVVDRWSLFRGHWCNINYKMDPKSVVVVGRWSLFGGGC